MARYIVLILLLSAAPAWASELEAVFYEGFSSFTAGSLGEAAESFEKLKETASSRGYNNLSDFSYALLYRAEQKLELGEVESARFLMDWAKTLSPTDPGLSLAIASRSGQMGSQIAEAASGVLGLWAYPTAFAAVVLNLLLLTLVGATLGWFIVCVLQAVRGGEKIVLAISNPFPLALRGIMGPACMCALLVVPLLFGVLVALGVWSLLLSFTLKRCRWLGSIAGIIILGWALSLPVYQQLAVNIKKPISLKLDIVNNGGYPSKDFVQEVDRQLKLRPRDQILKLLKARALALEGKLEEAESIYRGLSGKSGEFANIAKLNMAVIRNVKQDYQGAKDSLKSLEKMGYGSFALYYNLAAAHLGLVDLEAHREYYDKAKEYSSEGVKSGEKFVPVFEVLPSKVLYQRLVRFSKRPSMEQEMNALMKPLFAFGDLLLGFGIGVLMLGLFARFKSESRTLRRLRIEEKTSAIWAIIPGGNLVSGSRPVMGGLLLSAISVLLMLFLEQPIELISVFKVDMQFQGIFLGLALIMSVITVFLSLGGEAKN